MADNIQVANDSSNVVATIAADDISGIKYSRSKITLGADGVNDGDISSTNPMPVSGAVTVSGVATAANQATGNTSLGSIDTKLTSQATATKQDTGNASLTSIDGKTPALGQALAAAAVPVVLTALQQTALTPPAAITNFAVESGGHLQSIDTSTGRIPAQGQALSSASMPVVLPAAQITALTPPSAITNFATESGGHLASLDTKAPALGQALSANSVPVVLPAAQITTLTPPAAITNFANETGGNLATIAARTPALGQALAAASVPIVLTAIQQAALTPPAAITGYALESGGHLATIDTSTAKIPAQGQALASASMPVVLPVAQITSLTAPVLAAGTAIVGKVGIDQTTPGTTNGVQVNAALPAGANIIGKVTTDQTTHGTTDLVAADITKVAGAAIAQGHGTAASAIRVELPSDGTGIVGLAAGSQTIGALTANQSVNVAQINGVAPAMGNGVSGTGVQRVTLASDSTGVVVLNAGSNLVGKVGIDQTTSGTTNATVDIPCTSGGLSVSSFLSTAAVQSTAVKASAGQVYSIEFFNNGATPVYVRLYNIATAPASTDTANIIARFMVPGNTAGAGFVKSWEKGLAFSTGIGFRCTSAIADNDTTVLAANAVLGNIAYK